MERIRTFVALPIPGAVKRSVTTLTTRLRAELPAVRWTAEENLHLTLAFLGEVQQNQLADIGRAVTEVCAALHPWTIMFGGLGAFPNESRPNVFWVGVREGGEPVEHLHHLLADALEPLGYRRENRFVPHLTIGRSAGPRLRPVEGTLAAHASWHAPSFAVTQAQVYSSKLGPRGPQYSVLARAPFASG